MEKLDFFGFVAIMLQACDRSYKAVTYEMESEKLDIFDRHLI